MLSLALHGAALVLGLIFVPISPAETPKPRPVAFVFHSGVECLTDIDVEEEMAELECTEVPQVFVESRPALEPTPPEDEEVCDDLPPLEELPPETFETGRPDPLAFEVPLDAVRQRVKAPLPTAAPTRTAPRVPLRVSPTAARRRPVRAARPAPRRGALRISHAPRVTDYYPLPARRRGHEGTAIVVMVIEQNGLVSGASLAQSTGHTSLDEAALRLAREYRFMPPGARRRARMPITFVLHRST